MLDEFDSASPGVDLLNSLISSVIFKSQQFIWNKYGKALIRHELNLVVSDIIRELRF